MRIMVLIQIISILENQIDGFVTKDFVSHKPKSVEEIPIEKTSTTETLDNDSQSNTDIFTDSIKTNSYSTTDFLKDTGTTEKKVLTYDFEIETNKPKIKVFDESSISSLESRTIITRSPPLETMKSTFLSKEFVSEPRKNIPKSNFFSTSTHEKFQTNISTKNLRKSLSDSNITLTRYTPSISKSVISISELSTRTHVTSKPMTDIEKENVIQPKLNITPSVSSILLRKLISGDFGKDSNKYTQDSFSFTTIKNIPNESTEGLKMTKSNILQSFSKSLVNTSSYNKTLKTVTKFPELKMSSSTIFEDDSSTELSKVSTKMMWMKTESFGDVIATSSSNDLKNYNEKIKMTKPIKRLENFYSNNFRSTTQKIRFTNDLNGNVEKFSQVTKSKANKDFLKSIMENSTHILLVPLNFPITPNPTSYTTKKLQYNKISALKTSKIPDNKKFQRINSFYRSTTKTSRFSTKKKVSPGKPQQATTSFIIRSYPPNKLDKTIIYENKMTTPRVRFTTTKKEYSPSRGVARWVRRDPLKLGFFFDPVCTLYVDKGTGSETFSSWYYNDLTKQCEWFNYRGQNGNGNRFNYRANCENYCIEKQENLCFRLDIVNCEERWLECHMQYDKYCHEEAVAIGKTPLLFCPPPQPTCVSRNGIVIKTPLYLTHREMIPAECKEEKDSGLCFNNSDSVLVFYYNVQYNDCLGFLFSKCGGNSNRFPNKQECMNHCAF